jgi:hypothetical protein
VTLNYLLSKKNGKKQKSIVQDGVKVTQVKYGARTGQENNLLKSSNTEIIHNRSHATNSKHIDKPYYEFSKKRLKYLGRVSG